MVEIGATCLLLDVEGNARQSAAVCPKPLWEALLWEVLETDSMVEWVRCQ